MKMILITQCNDSLMWYRDKINQIVPLVREDVDPERGKFYWSREPAGYLNVVWAADAEIVDMEDKE